MRNFYFTFGQAHVNNQGEPMKDYYVHVLAQDYINARLVFNEWINFNMPSEHDWSMQYEESEFNKKMYKKGEYDFLNQE